MCNRISRDVIYRQNGDWTSLKLWATEDLAPSWEVDSEQGKEWLRVDSVLKPANKMYYSDIAEFWSTDIHNNIYIHTSLLSEILKYLYTYVYNIHTCININQDILLCWFVLLAKEYTEGWTEESLNPTSNVECTQGLHDLFYFTHFMRQWNEVIYQLLPTLIYGFWYSYCMFPWLLNLLPHCDLLGILCHHHLFLDTYWYQYNILHIVNLVRCRATNT